MRTQLCQAQIIVYLLGAGGATAQETRSNLPDFAGVEALVESQIAAGTPSIAISVTQHGKIIWERAFGIADKERNIPATPATPYYLASISKTITATGLMELIDEGKIDLTKPVNDYLGAAKLSSPMWNAAEATVLRMATHTAGLTTYDFNCLHDDHDCSTDTNNLIRRYGVIVWHPGDQFDYSNADYGILGAVIAHTANESLPEFLQRNVFRPLGMNDCFLDSDNQRVSSAAGRYDQGLSHPRTPPLRSTDPGASSMYCSVHDLALFGMFHLGDDLPTQQQILPHRSIREMQRSLVSIDDQSQYGLGWWIQPYLHGYRGVLAQGGTHDSTAYLELIPSEDISVAMLWNSGTPQGDKVIDAVLAALLPRYQKALATSNPQGPSTSAPAHNSKLNDSFVGKWRGSILAYKGQLPLTLTINPSGSGLVTLGSQTEFEVSHFQSDKGMLKWDMPGPSGLGDTGNLRYTMDIKLYLHGDILMGAARTRQISPATEGPLLFYAVKLRRL